MTAPTSPPAGRRYRSPRRAKTAADTRAVILAAATRLFVERGYGRVTVNDIAQAAGAAVPTVYASTGGKSAILATLVDRAMADPIAEASFAAIRASDNAPEAIRATARGVRADNERYHDLIQVMVSAAAVDETAGAVLDRSNHIYWQALDLTTDRLRELRALPSGLEPSRATDILWFFFGHRAWHLYVSERGWSWDEAERWLAEQATVALVATSLDEPVRRQTASARPEPRAG